MKRLRSLEVELEAVTPLWIGGAAAQAELRPPSVRGCLRFWFRALAGGLLGELLENVWQAESAVYGNTQRTSSVAVLLSGQPRTVVTVAGESDKLPGISYMFWSVFQQRRDAIAVGERFRLILRCRPYPLPPVEVAGRRLTKVESFALAAASLWLLLRLGGVGARVRRGAGGMRALAEPEGWPASLPPLVSRAATPAELVAELGAGIQRVRQAAGWSEQPLPQISSYDLLHPRVSQFFLTQRTFPSWWEAVNWLGEKFREFRVAYKLDASGIAALLLQGKMLVKTIQRAVLGLPIVFFFKSILADLTSRGVDPREARRKASASVGPARGQARASPLFFRILPLAGPQPAYTVLMGLFRSRLLPDDEMTVKPADWALRPVRLAAPSDFSVIEKWFDYVRAQDVSLLPVAVS